MKSKNKFYLRLFSFFLLLVAGVTFVCGLVYISNQQNYRQSANDPQIQMSEDISVQLSQGAEPTDFVKTTSVDIARSLAPFIIIYNDQGSPVASTARLNGKIPTIPTGVLGFTRHFGEDRITWQPEDDVRSATIIAHYTSPKGSGYVLVGRSLREVEIRESMLTFNTAVIWVIGAIGSLIASAILAVIESH